MTDFFSSIFLNSLSSTRSAFKVTEIMRGIRAAYTETRNLAFVDEDDFTLSESWWKPHWFLLLLLLLWHPFTSFSLIFRYCLFCFRLSWRFGLRFRLFVIGIVEQVQHSSVRSQWLLRSDLSLGDRCRKERTCSKRLLRKPTRRYSILSSPFLSPCHSVQSLHTLRIYS